ncbi:unnamed protein product, partial [Closterium sp. NIES-53]
KGEVLEVLIDGIRDRGGEFSSDLLRAFCRSEGIRQILGVGTTRSLSDTTLHSSAVAGRPSS